MTIPQRILWHVAIGAGLVIAVATGVTYGIVHSAAKERELRHLRTYVAERAAREESGFRQVEANLILVRGQFLRRMEGPLPRNIDGQWNERFQLFSDGAWRSRTNFADGRKHSTLWAHKNVVFTPELKTQVLRAQNICDDLLPGWVDAFPSVYFVLPGWLNIGFDPRLPSWVWDTPADYDPSALEWFQLSMPTNRLRTAAVSAGLAAADTTAFPSTNPPGDATRLALRAAPPSGEVAWSGVIEEPTTKVPIVSVYLPIVKDGQFIGSVGHDLFVNRLMEETTRSGLPGAMHVIFRRDGRLIAHPTKRQEILASVGKLRMQDSEPALASLYRTISEHAERHFSGYDDTSGFYYSVARLAGPEWFFLTTMPREQLQRQAFQSARWVLWSGLASLALLLAFLAATLRRQIAQPLGELTRATAQMSAGDVSARASVERKDELGTLAGAFNEMAGRVAQRDAELQAEKAALERRVTERTAELRESEARFVAAFRRSPAMQSLLRAEGRVLVEVNDTFLDKLGFARDQVIGRSPVDLNFWVEREELAGFNHELESSGFVLGRAVRLRARDGRVLMVLLSTQPVDIGGVPHFLSAGVDITEQKRAEAELQNALAKERELGQLKSEFVSLVSHEFRTPLEIILSSADNLRRYHDRLEPEKRGQLLQTIHKSVRRMSGMMEEVLVLGRLETDRMTFNPATFDLGSLCRRICDEIDSATSSRCVIDLRTDGIPGQAHGDESLLRHIFSNLLSNAVKYSPENARVEFAVRREGDTAVCRVTDKGCGIPLVDQKRLFQAFHRGGNVGQVPGTGLGLLIVQRCVALHGGKIQFESAESQGTTFTVQLPIFTQPTPTS